MKNPFPPLEAWTVETFKRAIASNTIRALLAGLIVQALIKSKLIPDSFFTNAVGAICDFLAILFRVSATEDLKTGSPLTATAPPAGGSNG